MLKRPFFCSAFFLVFCCIVPVSRALPQTKPIFLPTNATTLNETTTHVTNLSFYDSVRADSISGNFTTRRPLQQRDIGVVFPDQIDILQFNTNITVKPSHDVPECSKGNSYCTESEDYPVALIDSILKRGSRKFDNFFLSDEIVPTFGQRIGGFGEESLCQFREHIIYPKFGETDDKKWEYIINHDTHRQGVRVEECMNPDTPCSLTDSFPNSYRPVCQQKYMYRQLIGISTTGEIRRNTYKMPSCCQCVLFVTT